ncbi:MAG: uroporphyrinogen-III C-methyltransferase [Betaproteobacteria bacterium]|nr:MAG: uroporphyrinogen-III C-methyltransferase [Betaproteobacteria bacterium]
MSKKGTDEQTGNTESVTEESNNSEAKAATKDRDRKAASGAAADQSVAEQASVATSQPADLKPRQRRGASGLTVLLALLIALAAAGFTAWQNYELRRERAQLELELARKLDQIETIGSDSRKLSSDARDLVRDVDSRLGQLEARLAGMQNQRLAIESLYQELSQSRDEWTLAEVEQILLVASQQLQLAGNVKAALIALEAADARLARSDRPQLTQVRRVIAEDIERLKASPFVDVTGIGLKLERVIATVNELPLAMETRPAEENATPESDTAEEGWRLLVAEMWGDLLSLVRIQRIDAPETPLLAPDQAFFLKENLKLRLLGARLALLARDQAAYRADLAAAVDWTTRYFDGSAPPVASSIDTLNELAASDIQIELPDVTASLDAVRTYRLVKEPDVR